MTPRWMIVLLSALLAGVTGASAGDKTDVVRDLAGRVGPIIGSAWPAGTSRGPVFRSSSISSQPVITEASTNEAERSDLTQILDRNVANGRGASDVGTD